jgi:hypothetical protein
VQADPHIVSLTGHSHTAFEQTSPLRHVDDGTQLPLELHSLIPVLPLLHSSEFGTHVPTQAPPEQALRWHGVTVVPHCPFAPHVT